MEQQLSLGFLIPRWGRDESWGVCGFYGRTLSVFSLHLDAQTAALGRMGKKNTSSPAGASVRAWKEMKSPSHSCSGSACFSRSKPHNPPLSHFCYETTSKSLESCQVSAALKVCLLGVWSQME